MPAWRWILKNCLNISSLAVAIGGFALPFAMGFFVARYFGGTVFQSLFIGIGLSITAIAVQAVILQEMQIHKTRIGHIVMGAAIVDDILSLIGLSVLLGLVNTGVVDIGSVTIIIVKVSAFFAFTILPVNLLYRSLPENWMTIMPRDLPLP